MLVLTRREGEKIMIGDDIVITLLRRGSDDCKSVSIGITAPPDVVIVREELIARRRE